MFLEKVEGFGRVILRNFVFGPHDSFIIFSNSGVNQVVIDVALEAKTRGMPVIAVVSVAHCQASTPRHSSAKRLIDCADVTIDNCAPAGDALVTIEGLPYPVGPGSTIGYAAVVNALKCLVAAELTKTRTAAAGVDQQCVDWQCRIGGTVRAHLRRVSGASGAGVRRGTFNAANVALKVRSIA